MGVDRLSRWPTQLLQFSPSFASAQSILPVLERLYKDGKSQLIGSRVLTTLSSRHLPVRTRNTVVTSSLVHQHCPLHPSTTHPQTATCAKPSTTTTTTASSKPKNVPISGPS